MSSVGLLSHSPGKPRFIGMMPGISMLSAKRTATSSDASSEPESLLCIAKRTSLSLTMKNSYRILDPLASSQVSCGQCALAVMIKAPRAGASKTRLVPPLTPEEAAALSVCFFRDTAANIESVTADGAAEGIAVYTPAGTEEVIDPLLPAGFKLLVQRGDGFGERLLHAVEDLLSVGYQSLCLIDSDSPTLPQQLLVTAVEALSRPGDRVVLGAADDGGYYLIGLKGIHPRLFSHIDWSTAQVLEQTIARADEINLEVEVLPSWYDIDCAVSLGRLCEEMFAKNGDHASSNGHGRYPAPHTETFLRRLIGSEGRERIWPHNHAMARSAG